MGGKLDSICVAQQSSQGLIVGWQFFAFGVDAASSATVEVYRSSVENDGFVFVQAVPAVRGWYFDNDASLLNRWEITYYKLRLVVDGEVKEYDPVRVNGASDVRSRSLVKHLNTYLRLAGMPVLIYQYLNSGDRCLSCWDPVLAKVTSTKCPSCFGTGFENGYHAPVLTLSAMGVEGKQNIVGERVEQEATIEMLFSNFPVLRPGDLIYEIDAGRRYRVQQVLPVEKHRVLINQSVLGYALQPTDTEQNIPIPDISTLSPILRRKYAPHRKVSSTDGEAFNNQTFDKIRY